MNTPTTAAGSRGTEQKRGPVRGGGLGEGAELRVMRSALRSLLGPSGAVRASVGAGAAARFPG